MSEQDPAASVKLRDDGELLLRCIASMLATGNTAIRTREWMEALAHQMRIDGISVSISLGNVAATFRRAGESFTSVREIGPPGVNVWRICQLERLASIVRPPSAQRELAVELAHIESAGPLYSAVQIAGAVAIATAALAFLNGGDAIKMVAAAVGGGLGQALRSYLSHLKFNQYGVSAACAVTASGLYLALAALADASGFRLGYYPSGFIASVLFLIPGFPLIAALFDLLQGQTAAAVGRLAHGLMILVAVGFGVSIVAEVTKMNLSAQPPLEIAYSIKLVLRAAASFAAGTGFAILFNTPLRMALSVGLLAAAANSLRVALGDIGIMPAPASLFAALVIGIAALSARRLFTLPPTAITAAPIIIMVPGKYALEMFVSLNRGHMLEALQAAATCGFIIGALAMGLATARFFSSR